jgi:hypothetical protein
MIRLTVDNLKKIKDIVAELGIEEFTLKQEGVSGIGTILTLSYDTFVADHKATMTVVINGVKDW